MLVLIAAQPAPRARLEVVRDPSAPDATACAALDALAPEVGARLGRDPFAPDAERAVHVRWSGRGRVVRAAITIVEADGRRGERTLEDARCDELVHATALAIAIAIDPRVALGEVPAPAVAPAARARLRPRERDVEAGPPRAARAEHEPSPVARAFSPRPRRASPWHFGAGLGAELGATPGLALGVRVQLELGARYRARAALDFDYALAGDLDGVAEADALRVGARFEGCLAAALVACTGLSLVRAFHRIDRGDGDAGGFDVARDTLAWTALAGLALHRRARVELALAVPLTAPTRFRAAGRELWRSWPLTPSLRFVVTP